MSITICNISNLDDYLLRRIVKYLEPIEKIAYSRLSKRFATFYFSALKQINMLHVLYLTPELPELI